MFITRHLVLPLVAAIVFSGCGPTSGRNFTTFDGSYGGTYTSTGSRGNVSGEVTMYGSGGSSRFFSGSFYTSASTSAYSTMSGLIADNGNFRGTMRYGTDTEVPVSGKLKGGLEQHYVAGTLSVYSPTNVVTDTITVNATSG